MSNISISEIKSRIKTKSEKELRELLIILFEELKYHEVVHSHGTTEFGKDIVFYDVDKLGKVIWTACVVKANDVNQSNYHDIVRQVNECFKKPYNSHSQGRVKIDQVFVITSGIYKPNTRDLIAEEIENKTKSVEYKDIGDIARLIDSNKLTRFLIEEKDILLSKYHEHLQSVLKSDNSIQILGTDFNLDVNTIERFQIKIRSRVKSLKEEASKYLDGAANVVNVDVVPDIDKLLTSSRDTLILGIATSGKTTILKQIGISQLKRNPNANIFFVELSKLYTAQKRISIIDYVRSDFAQATGNPDFTFSNKQKNLLLLDGLDEVADDENKQDILIQLLELKKLHTIQIIITSRELDFIDNNLTISKLFEIHELLPLNNTEMIELGKRLLNDDDQTRNFTSLLKRSEIVNSFPKTPLATIILAILFKERKLDTKELPKNIYELYSKFIDLFLNRWDKSKGISEQFTIQQKEYVLKQIARHLHEHEMVSISFDDLFVFLKALSVKKPISGLEDPEAFLRKICQRSNILIRNDADKTFRFFHLTIQEFLAAGSLRKKDEDVLLQNFFDNWWLNPNIFYAGANPDESEILDRLSKFENFPLDLNSKMHFVIHTSKVLQAAHLLDKTQRKKVLQAMIKVFDQMNLDLIRAFVDNDEPRLKLKERTLLDRILWARNFFCEFFSSSQFYSELTEIWRELLNSKTNLSDVTQYCLSYCLAIKSKESKFLTEFLDSSEELNVRWYRIVDVDVSIKKLKAPEKKVSMRIRRKATVHRKYIQSQFKEALKKHYKSITGLK